VSVEKLLAARDLLFSTRRTLQLVDEEVAKIKEGRVAVEAARDVSSEHRVAWFGATDDNDHENGIAVSNAATGFGNPYRGTVRMQEDAAFVCTRIMVAVRTKATPLGQETFIETPQDTPFFQRQNVLLRMLDGNTGRNLTPGISTGPFDRDRGAIPLSFLSSFRFGLGSNFKNSLFSEFTLPRASTVRIEAFNMVDSTNISELQVVSRLFVSLYGYKVYGA